MRRVRMMAAIAGLGLAGCVVRGPEVVAVGRDTYQLTIAGAMFLPQKTVNQRALRSAGDFCARRGQEMHTDDSVEGGVHSWSAGQDNFIFVCVDESQRADNRQALATHSSP
jgi:hypothetical protein